MNFDNLVEALLTKNLLVQYVDDERSMNSMIEVFKSRYQETVCFHLGQWESFDTIAPVEGLIKPPYDVTSFEGDSVQGNRYVVWVMAIRDTYGGVCFYNTNHREQWFAVSNFELRQDRAIINCKESFSLHNDVVNVSKDLTRSVAVFLSALNCKNVSRIQHQPTQKLQKARVARGKLPLFSHWTLELNLDASSDRANYGGTHSSPRLHLRRGHARQYQPGKFCWVQAHVVGNKDLGMVHKDYKVTT